MRKSLERKTIGITSLLKFMRLNRITPFTEKPAQEVKESTGSDRKEPSASDLFSHFTADIIREEVVFTR